MVKCAWLAFLCYCPIVILIALTFGWAFPYFNSDEFSYSATGVLFKVSVLASWLGALLTALVYLFRPRKIILPVTLFLAPCAMIILSGPLSNAAFAIYIWPEATFVEKHCDPVDFVQDGKTYKLGVCDLIIATDGFDDFNWIYDTSADIKNFDHLSVSDRKLFAMTLRHYYNDDPNDGFEYADFTAERYDGNFYDIYFQEQENQGFTAAYGRPPKNSKSPYRPFW